MIPLTEAALLRAYRRRQDHLWLCARIGRSRSSPPCVGGWRSHVSAKGGGGLDLERHGLDGRALFGSSPIRRKRARAGAIGWPPRRAAAHARFLLVVSGLISARLRYLTTWRSMGMWRI